MNPSIQRVSEGQELSALLEYDLQCFGVDRKEFMLRWINNPSATTFYEVNAASEVVGFTVLRQTSNGWKIGPLFAEDYTIAESLYTACLNEVPGEKVYLDIPCSNENAVKLATNYQTEYVFECARMYYGSPLELPINKVFGITTFELG